MMKALSITSCQIALQFYLNGQNGRILRNMLSYYELIFPGLTSPLLTVLIVGCHLWLCFEIGFVFNFFFWLLIKVLFQEILHLLVYNDMTFFSYFSDILLRCQMAGNMSMDFRGFSCIFLLASYERV